MRVLLISDSHGEDKLVTSVLERWQDSCDVFIHCGDSLWTEDSELAQKFDLVVRGNHDKRVFPTSKSYTHMLVVHGHLNSVYETYDELEALAKDKSCTLCLHGHTHIPTLMKQGGITFINPGSIFMNRWRYACGSYAILDIDSATQEYTCTFYRADTHEVLTSEMLFEAQKQLEIFRAWSQRFD